MTTKLINNIPLFNWKGLDGKVLKIVVYEENDNRIIAGYEADTGIMYILDTEVKQKCLEI